MENAVNLLALVAVATAVIAVLWAAKSCLQMLAASAVRRRIAMEDFYKHANGVYDAATKPVPEEISDLLEFLSNVMTEKRHVGKVVSSLINGRSKRVAREPKAGSEISKLNEDQLMHFFKAYINSALVSAESSLFLASMHKGLLYYALSNPPKAVEAQEQVKAFATKSRADCGHENGGLVAA